MIHIPIVEFVIFPVCALFMQYNEHENTRNTTVHCVQYVSLSKFIKFIKYNFMNTYNTTKYKLNIKYYESDIFYSVMYCVHVKGLNILWNYYAIFDTNI